MDRLTQDFRGAWAVLRKDLAIWIRSPMVMAVTLLPSLVVMVVLNLAAASVTTVPVALVNRDAGVPARTLVRTIESYQGFSVTPASTSRAKALYDQLQVAAVITIPPGFSQAVQNHQPATIDDDLRNFDNDSTDDLRRGMAVVLTRYMANVPLFGPNPIAVSVRETDIHPWDAGFVAFMIVGVIAQLVLQSGVINASLATVREWEKQSIKELLLAPLDHGALIAGKVGAGVAASLIVGTAAMLVAEWSGLVAPSPFPNVPLAMAALGLIVLLGIFSAGVGVTVASAMRKTQKVIPVSINLAFYLFFLSGGIAAVAFFPPWLQTIAGILPTTYAIDGLRETLLYHSGSGLARDFVILAGYAGLGLAMGIPFLRRGLQH